jgi:hypothetical protein
MYLLTFVWGRGAVFMVKEGPAILAKGLDHMDLDRKDR